MAETHQALSEEDGSAEEEQGGHDHLSDILDWDFMEAGGVHGRQGIRG